MKNLFWVMCVVASVSFLSWNNPAYAGGETKEVCHDKVGKDGKPVMDKKTGKPAQECKKIKVHKKLEGTEVPVKK
jgi:hypothetical protein